MVFGILESGLSVAGSLVGIFICIAGVPEKEKSLYSPVVFKKEVQKKKKTYL